VIGLDQYEGNLADLDFFQLIGCCRTHSIQVLGVRGGDEDVRRLARNASLAWLPAGRAGHPLPDPPKAKPLKQPRRRPRTAMPRPVRARWSHSRYAPASRSMPRRAI